MLGRQGLASGHVRRERRGFRRRCIIEPALRCAVFGLLVAAAPLLAHHAIQAEFDYNLNSMTGTLRRVERVNPHADGRVLTIWFGFESGVEALVDY